MGENGLSAKTRTGGMGFFDTEFIEKCVAEFEIVDPKSERFRYHGNKFGVDRRPSHERTPVLKELYIDYRSILTQMKHVWDILNTIDVYLVETHGQNAEWESE